MSVLLRACGLVCALILLMSDLARAGELLEWKDVTGKFSVKAEFVELTDTELKLKREGGAELKIPLEKLSPESIAQAKKLAASATAETKPEVKLANPYNVPKLLIPDWSKAKRINLDKLKKVNAESDEPASVPWKLVLKSKLVTQLPQPAYSRIVVPKYKSPERVIGNQTYTFLSTNHAKSGVICESIEDYKHPVTVINQLNLENGKLLDTHLWKDCYFPIAYHESSKLLLVKSKKDYSSVDTVEIWQLTDKGINRKLMWDPFETSDSANAAITQAYFLDDNRVLLISERDYVSVWDINTGVVLFCIAHSVYGGEAATAVNLEQNLLAYERSRKIYLLSLTDYQLVGEFPSRISCDKLAFSPDGRKLAVYDSGELQLWDLESQKKMFDKPVRCEHISRDQNFFWVNQQQILAGEFLYDIESNQNLVKYKNINSIFLQGDYCICLPKHDRFSANETAETINLLLQKLPHPEASTAYQNFTPPPPAYYLVPGPDARISIDVSGIQDAKTQQQALQAMTKQLTGYGYQISDDAVFKLIATESHSDNYKREFRRAGSSNTVIVDYRYHLTYLKLILGENVIWQTSRRSGGIGTYVSDNELAEFQKNGLNPNPNYDLFLNTKLPEKFEKVIEKGFKPGTWKLTNAGFVPDKN